MGCKILKCVTWPWARPWLDVSRLGLATINLQTKFEVSNYSHNQDIRSSAKCTNWGSLGHLGSLKVIGNVTIDRARMTSYSTLIETMRLFCTVFWDIASYLSKVANFDPPLLHWAPSKRVTAVKFRGDLWRQKTRIPGLSCSVVCVILRLAVLVELRLVSHRQTQTQTQEHG